MGGDTLLYTCFSPRQPRSLLAIGTVRSLCQTPEHAQCPRHPRASDDWVEITTLEQAGRDQSLMVAALLVLLLVLAAVAVLFARLR